MRLLVHNARQLVLVTDGREDKLCGRAMGRVKVLESTTGLSIAIDDDGHILTYGEDADVYKETAGKAVDRRLDAQGGVVLPGLVDAHTHPLWAGDRVHEFALKLAGASYLDILTAGGGILSTVDATKLATDEQLTKSLTERLEAMLRAGTTTAEVKTGYGLTTQEEIRHLRLLEGVRRTGPVELSITHCGAHAVPRGMDAQTATTLMVTEQLPAIADLRKSGQVLVENEDVFLEKGVFNQVQAEAILSKARILGLRLNFHGDELSYSASGELAEKLGATAVSHLEHVSAEGMAAMARSSSVAVLLPTTAFSMRLKPPPARALIDAGVPVALGSDFNPNAYTTAMPVVMHLAVILFGITLPEALVAATLNAAAAVGRSKTHGSLERDKVGDLLILDAPRWEHLVYRFGGHTELISAVVKSGRVVYERNIS